MADGDAVTAAVIIIGNEILSGRTQDTNLNFIARHLGDQGVTVRAAMVIPDIHTTIIDTVNSARASFDYVLTTGGIGPTHDDITAECIARAFDVDLVMSPEIEQRIRQREAPEDVMQSRLRMARIPRGASLIDNTTGGPQGFSIENVYVMAGIPMVMQAMIPTIAFRGGAIVRSCSVTAYLGESEIAVDLTAIQDAHPGVDLGSYPFFREQRYGTSLVIRGTDQSELDSILAEVCDAIRARGQEPADIHRDWSPS